VAGTECKAAGFTSSGTRKIIIGYKNDILAKVLHDVSSIGLPAAPPEAALHVAAQALQLLPALHVKPAWIRKHAPGLHDFEASALGHCATRAAERREFCARAPALQPQRSARSPLCTTSRQRMRVWKPSPNSVQASLSLQTEWLTLGSYSVSPSANGCGSSEAAAALDGHKLERHLDERLGGGAASACHCSSSTAASSSWSRYEYLLELRVEQLGGRKKAKPRMVVAYM